MDVFSLSLSLSVSRSLSFSSCFSLSHDHLIILTIQCIHMFIVILWNNMF